MSTRMNTASKAFNLARHTTHAGEREAALRGCLRLVAAELGVEFNPERKINPVEQWGVCVKSEPLIRVIAS